MSSVIIRAVGAGARVGHWIAVPPVVHAGNPHFIHEIDLKERMRVARWGNPFFEFGEAALFVAFRGGRPVGRISAQVNRLHRQHHDPHSGHFGFFDCIDDQAVADALFDAARTWLKDRGATSISGPFSFTINEESGLQVEGFDQPAAMLMNQARPYSGALVEAAGLAKEIDTFAFRMRGVPNMPALDRLASSVERSGAVRLRPIRVDRFEDEVRLLVEIFNDAWSGNWGFVPFSEGEIKAMARELKPFYAAEYGRFVEVDGEPIGFLIMIPDINGIAQPFNGALLPWNWWRLLSQLRGKRFKSARVPLMGIRKAHQGTVLSAGILALLTRDMLRVAQDLQLEWSEFSWVLETNRPMLSLGRLIAGPPSLRYRFYRGTID